MKKIIIFCFLVLFLSVVAACAMGPVWFGDKTAQWDIPASGTPTGFYLYWRTPGTSDWPTSQRVITTSMTLNLVDAGLPQGLWQIAVTAYDAVSESAPSNTVTWVYVIVGNPGNLRTVK